LLIDEFFRPERLAHVVITWIGNAWLYLLLVAVAAAWITRRRETRLAALAYPAVALAATGFALLVGYRYMDRGGDGNYFAVGVAAATLLGLAAAWSRLADRPRVGYALAHVLCAFAAFQAAYSFVGDDWAPGTRRFDLDFSRGIQPTHEHVRQLFESRGLGPIADALASRTPVARAVGSIGDELVGFQLPCRYEDLAFISYSRPGYLSNPDALLAYMRGNAIDFLILPRHGAADTAPPLVKHVVADLLAELGAIEAAPGVRRVDAGDYLLLDFSNASATQDAQAAPSDPEAAGRPTAAHRSSDAAR
jgi:hypothetical protein